MMIIKSLCIFKKTMGSHEGYKKNFHEVGKQWIVQGDTPDQWFIAEPWQVSFFDKFVETGLDFTSRKNVPYRIDSVRVPGEKNRLMMMSNKITGTVRMINRCRFGCNIYKHSGPVKNAVILHKRNPRDLGEDEDTYEKIAAPRSEPGN
jgi:hypothetical protein